MIYFFITICSHACLSFVSVVQKSLFLLVIMVPTCDPSTWDVEAEGPRLATLPQKQTNKKPIPKASSLLFIGKFLLY